MCGFFTTQYCALIQQFVLIITLYYNHNQNNIDKRTETTLKLGKCKTVKQNAIKHYALNEIETQRR